MTLRRAAVIALGVLAIWALVIALGDGDFLPWLVGAAIAVAIFAAGYAKEVRSGRA